MNREKAEAAYTMFLQCVGIDTDTPNTAETAERVVRMFTEELASSVNKKAEEELKLTVFEQAKPLKYAKRVSVEDIPFVSLCAHHMLPFSGKASISVKYAENTHKIIGLSKFARIVKFFASKPQTQEELTEEIGEFLASLGLFSEVCIELRASHACMEIRGIKAIGAQTGTSFNWPKPHNNEYITGIIPC